jgi:radical SAM protein with 4Fe4S-binding SPASM domain
MARAELNEAAVATQLPKSPVPIGTPMAERADRLRIVEEEERRFRPVIYWYLTFRCNLACAHCSVHSSPWFDTSEDLNTEECLRVIDQMAELNVSTALVTGGEFLIRPDSLLLIRTLAERGIGIGLESNGLRYPEGFIELARELQSRHLFGMTVSLDGGTRETHERLRGPRSFDRTVRGLRELKAGGVRFNIQCVLNSSNLETIPEIYRLALELYPECGTVQWAILNPVGRGAELVFDLGLQPHHIPRMFALVSEAQADYPGSTVVKVPPAIIPPKYLPLISKGPKVKPITTCQFPLLGVLPNGDVSICAVSRDNQELHFGNIRDEGVRLKGIWEKTRMDMLRSRYVAAQDLEGICGDCIWKYTCKGGCRAWAYEEGGSFDSAFPLCKALDDAGAFPPVYRLSHQQAAAAAQYQQMHAGCSCST